MKSENLKKARYHSMRGNLSLETLHALSAVEMDEQKLQTAKEHLQKALLHITDLEVELMQGDENASV